MISTLQVHQLAAATLIFKTNNFVRRMTNISNESKKFEALGNTLLCLKA